jgi:Tfp pilus assembly protein FimT
MCEVIFSDGPAKQTQANGESLRRRPCQGRSSAGYSAVEMLLVVTMAIIMCAMAIPTVQSAMASYDLSAAVDSVRGAIQATRYQAIMHGYPYQVALNPTGNTIQVLSEAPPATTFTNVGAAVPISPEAVTLSAATTLQFKPNGSVSAPLGAMTFSISYKGTTKTLTVSNYGSISVQ